MKIIAELCQNHSGNVDTLRKMADAAAESGATHIKIQHIYTRNLTFRPEFENGLTKDGKILCIKRPWKAELERLKALELTDKDCCKFAEHVKDIGLTPMTTCFARADASLIKSQGFECIKIASYDCSSYQLIREASSLFDEIYVSTGATYDNEVQLANTILKNSNKPYYLLHCVTQYPTPIDAMNLARMSWLQTLCPSVGFSDHSLVSRDGVEAAKAACALGAVVVERHFTLDDASKTKDGPVSIGPKHLQELAAFSKLSKNDKLESLNQSCPNWKIMIGSPSRSMTVEELLNRSYYRGRFASPFNLSSDDYFKRMIYNWEEVKVSV